MNDGFVSQRATRAIVDLAALSHNMTVVRSMLQPGTQLLAVVKANAYGHGIGPVAHEAIASGADWLGVACVDEALAVRQTCRTTDSPPVPILVMGPADPAEYVAALTQGVTLAIGSLSAAHHISDVATALGVTARVHLKVDTGMNRFGMRPTEAIADLPDLLALPNLVLDGLFTHFASAEEVHNPLNDHQLTGLLAVRSAAQAIGATQVIIHAANSAALFSRPDSHFDMVRPGIVLYGYSPFAQDEASLLALPESTIAALKKLRPVLSLRSCLTRSWVVQPGEGVSYSHLFLAGQPTPAGLVPLGYADGLPRIVSGRHAHLLVGGRRVPIIGRICMDQCVLDLTTVTPTPQVGDEVVVIGQQRGASVTADDLGHWAETNSYEILCRVAARVPRFYINNTLAHLDTSAAN